MTEQYVGRLIVPKWGQDWPYALLDSTSQINKLFFIHIIVIYMLGGYVIICAFHNKI